MLDLSSKINREHIIGFKIKTEKKISLEGTMSTILINDVKDMANDLGLNERLTKEMIEKIKEDIKDKKVKPENFRKFRMIFLNLCSDIIVDAIKNEDEY